MTRERDALRDEWSERYARSIHAIHHDLGAPLRHVTAFSDLLLAELGAGLADDHREWLEHIHGAGALAQAMMDALRRLSRSYTDPVQLRSMTPEDIAAALNLPPTADLPAARFAIDLSRLTQAVRELSRNASLWGEGATAQIGVADDALRIEVINKGAGLASDRWQQALSPLNRLGEASTIEHPGIGLTLVQSWVEQMGGLLLLEHRSAVISIATAERRS